MENNERRIERVLKQDKDEWDAEEVLKKEYAWVFNNWGIRKTKIINIQTTYNDYKKLHDDMQSAAKDWGEKMICFSEQTEIQDMVRVKELTKMCKKEGMLEGTALLGFLEACQAFLCFISIFQILFPSFLIANKILWIVLFVLALLAIIPIVNLAKKQRHKALRKLCELCEDDLIQCFKRLGVKGTYLTDETIYFVENFSKLDKNCRCYIIAYLDCIEDMMQLWCIFDYLFEKTRKINVSGQSNKKYDEYLLTPLSYEKKAEFYKEYNLQREIAIEYLNCIGLDILWADRENDLSGEFKFHSLQFIEKKIKEVQKGFDGDAGLTKMLYCLVYMSAKYRYSFSMKQIISLMRNEEKINEKLYNMICDAGEYICGKTIKTKKEIQCFFEKILDVLEGYYFVECKREGGRLTKKYKFSYDILECFQKELSEYQPGEKAVKRWVLLKLIGNMEMFRSDRYFFDCSNLLVTNEFLEDEEFCTLSSNLLKMMNKMNCWLYYSPILKMLRDIDLGDEKWEYLEENEVKAAAIYNMLYVSDEQCIDNGLYFLMDSAKNQFALDKIHPWAEEMENCSSLLAGYFKLLYKIFKCSITELFILGKLYEDVTIERFGEQEHLPNIIWELLMLYVTYLDGKKSSADYDVCSKRISEHLKKIGVCTEAKAFSAIVEELLLWIKSEVELEEERAYKNVNVGMLIEASNSNMLHFIYGLFNMELVEAKEVVFGNPNKLLNFISQSVFYFRVIAQGKDAAIYANSFINGKLPIDLKINLALCLLGKDSSCKGILRDFIVRNIENIDNMIRERLEEINGYLEMEEWISELLIYNGNMNQEDFTEKVFTNILERLSEDGSVESDKICRYLKVIRDGKCGDEECSEIIDEINHITSYFFARWVLHGYCNAKEEIIERIPLIDKRVLVNGGDNIGFVLMGRYLMRHGYYDCDQSILKIYLNSFRVRKYPSKQEIEVYMAIVDSYEEDNRLIKIKEMYTYNNMMSLLFFYRTIELYGQMMSGNSMPQNTLEYINYVFNTLLESGMKAKGNRLRKENVSERNEDIETYIIENFQEMKPTVEINQHRELFYDYFISVSYMCNFPDVYYKLASKVKKGEEVIKQKYVLYLVDLLLERMETGMPGGNRENLERTKAILDEMYNLKY